jgi:hypothetical protein
VVEKLFVDNTDTSIDDGDAAATDDETTATAHAPHFVDDKDTVVATAVLMFRV